MKLLFLIISATSTLARVQVNDDYCAAHGFVYHYHNGTLVDSVNIVDKLEQIKQFPIQEQRLKMEENLMNIKPCNGNH